MALPKRLAVIAGGLGGIGSATGRLLRARGVNLALLYPPFEAPRAQDLLREGYNYPSSRIEPQWQPPSPQPSERNEIEPNWQPPDREDGGTVAAFECDISEPSSVNEAFGAIEHHAEQSRLVPSILVNAAGYVSLSPLEETTPEDIRKTLDANLTGPFLCGQAFARMYFAFAERARELERERGVTVPGRIVSIASQAAHVALDKHGIYCASKAGLLGLTRCMASEWGGRGICANSVSPGVVWTALGKKAWSDDAVREAYQKSIPTGRFAEPEEVAQAIEYLCLDDKGMINGADVRLDGGFTIR